MPKKQKSGLYRTKVKIGVGPGGKDIVKYISGKTRAELEAARRAVIEYYIEGTGLRQDMMFGDYAVKWYRTLREPRLSESSKASYRSMFNNYVFPEFGVRKLKAITASDLQRWLNSFAGKSDTTIALAATIIRGVFSAAYADRIIPNDPSYALKLPKASKEQRRRALTPDETEKIQQVIHTHPYGSYMACLYYLGARPGEVRGLMWGDFDWERDVVKIQRDIDYRVGAEAGALKTEAAYREIPIFSALRDILYPMRALPNAYLFTGQRSCKPLSKASAERIWIDMMQSVGLTEYRDSSEWKHPDVRAKIRPVITPYYLRHNFLTLCWEAGLDPMVTMRIAGHTDYRTTVNVYTHLQEEQLQNARMELESVFNRPKVAQKLHKPQKELYRKK